jgi:hypothetical protein
MRPKSHSHIPLAILAMAVALVVAACGGGTDSPAPDISTAAPGGDTQPSASAAPGGPAAALDAGVLARAGSVDETATADGGQVMVAIECEAQTGGDLLHAGAVGLAEGIYTGTVDPAIGGSVKFQVGTDGSGSTARQSTLDQATYTVTFADIDGGIELTVAGCTG